MKEPKPYDLNLVKINNHAKVVAEQEIKFHKKHKPMSKKAKRIGDAITVENKDRKFGSANHYIYVRLQSENGDEKEYLFTSGELVKADVRARSNKEDLPEIGWLRNLID